MSSARACPLGCGRIPSHDGLQMVPEGSLSVGLEGPSCYCSPVSHRAEGRGTRRHMGPWDDGRDRTRGQRLGIWMLGPEGDIPLL